jgi:hypothetical protein
VVEFADWRLGPLEAFDTSWADPAFKAQATAFPAKFVVGHHGKPIERPSLLCRRNGPIDGVLPTPRNGEHSISRSASRFSIETPEGWRMPAGKAGWSDAHP